MANSKDRTMGEIPEDVLWAVYTNSDLTEGRGQQFVKHFCRTEATAKRLAKRGYIQGGDCPIKVVKALVLDGRYVLPISLLTIVEPSDEDEKAQSRILDHRAALAKAKELGLSDQDISAIRGNIS